MKEITSIKEIEELINRVKSLKPLVGFCCYQDETPKYRVKAKEIEDNFEAYLLLQASMRGYIKYKEEKIGSTNELTVFFGEYFARFVWQEVGSWNI